MFILFYCLALLLSSNNHAQNQSDLWKVKFENGSFHSLEKELNAVIQTNHSEKHDALKILGDLYKVRGDVETAFFYWNKSDSILKIERPGLNSKAIELAHLSNFYFEKFNPEMTKLYNDSLINIVSQLESLAINDCWIWNVIAQSNKLALDNHNGSILSIKNIYYNYIF